MRQRLHGIVLLPVVGAASWFGMMVAHESGHVLHAWVSGGRVAKVVLHPLAFSRTDFVVNPHPLFVAWGGVVWGCVLPLLLLLLAMSFRYRLVPLGRFFAGFCLIANGAYLATAVVAPVGDAEDLLRLGAPLWTLFLVGAVIVGCGFVLWNRIGTEFGFGEKVVDRAAVVFASLSLVALVGGMLVWSTMT